MLLQPCLVANSGGARCKGETGATRSHAQTKAACRPGRAWRAWRGFRERMRLYPCAALGGSAPSFFPSKNRMPRKRGSFSVPFRHGSFCSGSPKTGGTCSLLPAPPSLPPPAASRPEGQGQAACAVLRSLDPPSACQLNGGAKAAPKTGNRIGQPPAHTGGIRWLSTGR